MPMWEIIEAAATSLAPVIILPDLSGVGEQEIPAVSMAPIRWM